MKVSLGTLELTEDEKRALGKRIKGSVRVNRNEVREYVLGQVAAIVAGGEVTVNDGGAAAEIVGVRDGEVIVEDE